MNIKNKELIEKTLSGTFVYERIVKIEYNVENDFEDNYVGTLDLTFHVTLLKTKDPYKIRVRYYNVDDLTIREATTFPLSGDLIIHDMKDQGLVSSQRYHVHDDSGYGENDGFEFIEFYCTSIKVISVEEFYKEY
ncbi:hypothetical protein [Lysinibacillus odysseyi]|uniref:Uncharacterized protein n=1 Tax=Lysinibacillus odysseyi 34hs-1 = NBRC 100172 TaxID=1220589 RepID=A0A0A3IC08_9BACI|nr:hypothetical protein [Lysinibacillus odysseyi]KGR82254.1 hypothetical protein CD32_23555 [Lysinibacillus odysseyi 34hs-1 = NBRC 100172]